MLESLLNKNRVGLSGKKSDHAFEELADYVKETKEKYYDSWVEDIKKRFGVESMIGIEPFEEAYKGYYAFCGLFFQDPFQNYNILECLREKCDWYHFTLEDLDYPKSKEKEVHDLVRSIMKYLKGIDIEDFKWPKDLYEKFTTF